ncbi:ABC transporter permease [Ichthyenterobacterium magnum]|uniref:Putative ABC transport system permease protein n=1 Tax=Ichthyenterobacterium magnum TaxID=1230530 RepID=A0A420DXN9_9FLAO|nr:ABC transporter permease [Ichthyenterobacterium magnum]RKE98967.1 putative ABC transport system permease protein [Ichthyenterobacterium magnum]
MFKNYIKVAFRTLNKNRVYATINILGLALGLTVTILVFLFIKDETSYEKHWDGYERIYRTGIKADMMGQKMNAPVSCSPMANAFRTEFTDVETATRVQTINQEILMRHEQNKVYIQKGARVDSTFFKVFDYEFIHGNADAALKETNAIVLTEESARKLFGDKNALGEIVNYDNRQDYVVRGVVKDPKGHAHFQFDMFLADHQYQNIWMNNGWYTYVKLKEDASFDAFKAEMTRNFMKKIEPDVERFLKITAEEFFAQGNAFEYQLQPLKDIHLHSKMDFEIKQNGDIIYIYVFIGIALLVILIAGINFMNLSTARSGKRAKEVGVRKVSGASRKMLITQFLTESVIQSFIALFLAFILVELFLPGFNNIMETNITLFNDYLGKTVLFALLVTLVYGLFAGSYPAFFLSAFQPISVLKGDLTKTKGGALLRKALVIIQFTASTILIIGMIIIFKQISFLHNKDIGFKGDQVIVVPLQTDPMTENFRNYKDIFLKNSNVLSVTRASYYPGDNPNQSMFALEGREEQLPLWNMEVDYDFFKTLDIELLEGRKFEIEKESDSIPYFILNETAVKNLNIENAVGRRLGRYTGNDGSLQYGNIIGIVKDFHIEGFNQPIRPMILTIEKNVWFASFKIAKNDMNATIDYIETEWNKLEPTHPFRYTFLDQKFGALLRQQENFGTMFLFLTILAIIISAMGLYGLASYTAEQRTKEIGIRKVLGASVSQIMNMLTKDFIKLVLVANIFAWPITYLLAKNWLSNFSYQIDMPLLPYVFATLLALIIALITVSFQAYQSANSDPVDALKYE